MRGDDIFQTALEDADEVELSLADNGQARIGQRTACFVEAEEGAAFAEERGLGRVDVFGRILGGRENASAEGNDFAVVVADGKHEALAEPVGQRFVLAAVEEPAGPQLVVFEAGGARVFEQGAAVVGRVADLPIFRDVGADLAGFEVVAGGGAGGRAKKVGVEPVGGGFVQHEESLAQFAALVVTGCGFVLENGDTGFLREAADRGGEVDAFVFHDELEDAAPGAAAEAVVGLLLRADVEGWGFLAVEGAEGAPTRAGAFEREVAADDFDNVAGGGDALDTFLGDAGHGRDVSGWGKPGRANSPDWA